MTKKNFKELAEAIVTVSKVAKLDEDQRRILTGELGLFCIKQNKRFEYDKFKDYIDKLMETK